MFTEKHSMGKFEGCRSELVGRVLYDGDPDEEFSNSDDFVDWYGLVKGKRYWFIVHEDSQGFVSYLVGSKEKVGNRWDEAMECESNINY